MMHSRRVVLGGISAILAGCVDTPSDGPRGSPTETDGPSTDGSTEVPPGECDPPTPTPTQDLWVANLSSTTVTATVTVTEDGTDATDGEPVFEETITVEPRERWGHFDVFPKAGTYVVRVELDDGTTVSETVDAYPDDRRSLVEVTIRDDIDVGTLLVVPEPTPTPCDAAR